MNLKNFLLIIFLTSILISCDSQSGNGHSTLLEADTLATHSVTTLTDTTVNDTAFIFRTITPDYYHAVYIDTNRSSKEYKKLTNFTFNSYYQEAFESNYHSIKEKYPNGYKVRNETHLPVNWLPVYNYKGKYYLYDPSDGGNIGRLIITDTSFVDWGMEGPFPRPFQSIHQTNKRSYQISLEDPFSRIPENIQITILDPTTKLSLFETTEENNKTKYYELYVPVEYATHFAIVVNYTNIGKHPEFEFKNSYSDEIQQASLLNSFKKDFH